MAQQTINIGTAPNDGTGTPLRTSFDYCNLNFTELYTAVGPSGNNIVVPGSATITGDLTVDTSTLKVDSTNDRVGIGTASPALPLDVVGGIQVTSGSAGGLYQLAYGASASSRSWRAWNDVSANGDFQISTSTTRTGSTYSDRYRIDVTGIHEWFNTSGTAMTLNSTGLLVGGTTAQIIAAESTTLTTIGNIGAAYSASTGTYFAAKVGAPNGIVELKADARSGAYPPMVFTTGNVQRMQIDASGNVGVGVTPSAGGGCLQLKSGITFPATQVASSDANTLDDYEEGTFVPTVIGTTSAGTGTYTTQVGLYTKVGNLVTVQVNIGWTAHTGTGSMRLAGLPFAASSAANSNSAVAFGYVNDVSLTAGNVLTGFTSVSNSFIDCYQTPSGGGVASVVPIDTSAQVLYSVSYRV
jgi:hypothetical protein